MVTTRSTWRHKDSSPNVPTHLFQQSRLRKVVPKVNVCLPKLGSLCNSDEVQKVAKTVGGFISSPSNRTNCPKAVVVSLCHVDQICVEVNIKPPGRSEQFGRMSSSWALATDNFPHLLLSQLSSPFVEINISLPQYNMGITSADTLREDTRFTQLKQLHKEKPMEHSEKSETHLDGCDGKCYLSPPINVRVENTKNMLELFRNDQRLEKKKHQTEVWIKQSQ